MTEEEYVLFEIALSLKTPVYKLVQEMPYEELIMWVSYFENKPIEWRNDLRAAYIMRTFGDKRRPSEIFPSLASLNRKPLRDPAESLKGSLFLSKLLSAKAGDDLAALRSLE